MFIFLRYLDQRWMKVTISLALVWFIAFLFPTRSNFASNLSSNIFNLPYFSLDFQSNRASRAHFNASKLALMIEGHPKRTTAPLILHTIAVVPPDWPFLFIGSVGSVSALLKSRPVRDHIGTGKLVVKAAPLEYDVTELEGVTAALTSLPFYEKFIDPAEWLFTFDSNSMLCANSAVDLDAWLGYGWVSAPWQMHAHVGGGEWDRLPGRKYRDEYNGGLALRRVSTAKRVLAFQTRTEAEYDDVFFMDKLPNMPGSRVLNNDTALRFAVKDRWYDKPVGFSIADFDKSKGEVWGVRERRDRIWDYCPDVKMLLPMELEHAQFRCGGQ